MVPPEASGGPIISPSVPNCSKQHRHVDLAPDGCRPGETTETLRGGWGGHPGPPTGCPRLSRSSRAPPSSKGLEQNHLLHRRENSTSSTKARPQVGCCLGPTANSHKTKMRHHYSLSPGTLGPGVVRTVSVCWVCLPGICGLFSQEEPLTWPGIQPSLN